MGLNKVITSRKGGRKAEGLLVLRYARAALHFIISVDSRK
nr:MAG TPA: hypothetical protein [Caudoviricetes sp.]